METNTSSGKCYGAFSHEGFYVKDYCVYRSPIDRVYHLYYNIGKADGEQDWGQPFNEKQFGHATSVDLRRWEIHDTLLPVIPGTWESTVVSAPFVVRHDGRFYMAYTGFGGGTANQRMGIAMSDDLFHWTRLPQNPVAVGPEWSTWREVGWSDYRDPCLLKWGDQWLAFNTVSSRSRAVVSGDAVAVSVSKDLINWSHLPEDRAIFADWGNPESPVAFTHGARVYLIASQPWQGRQMWVTDDPLAGHWETVDFEFPEGAWSGWEYVLSPEGKELLSAFLWKMGGNFIRFWELAWEGEVPRLIW
jgi:beta-fructofuranosidase